MDIEIGSKFWVFDGNRRVYNKNFAQPDYSKHFIQVEIIDETSRSWIVGGHYEFKAPKKDPFKFLNSESGFRKQLLTDQDKDDMIWANSHKCEVIRKIESCDLSVIREIAKMIGYNHDT